MFQNKLFLSLLFFVVCLFFTSQNSLAQDLEMQYKTAIDEDDASRAGKLAYQIAQKHYKEGKEKETIDYLNEAIKYSISIKDYDNLGKTYSLLGVIYKKQQNYNLAIFNYGKATQVYTLLGDKKLAASSHYLEGILYDDTQQYDKAITVLKETIHIANQANATDLVLQSSEYLSKIYRKKGDISNANLYENVTEEIKDQVQEVISEEQKAKALTIEEMLERNSIKSDSLEQLYSKTIAEREADKKLFTYIVIGVTVTFILLIIIIIIQRIKLKKKAKSH